MLVCKESWIENRRSRNRTMGKLWNVKVSEVCPSRSLTLHHQHGSRAANQTHFSGHSTWNKLPLVTPQSHRVLFFINRAASGWLLGLSIVALLRRCLFYSAGSNLLPPLPETNINHLGQKFTAENTFSHHPTYWEIKEKTQETLYNQWSVKNNRCINSVIFFPVKIFSRSLFSSHREMRRVQETHFQFISPCLKGRKPHVSHHPDTLQKMVQDITFQIEQKFSLSMRKKVASNNKKTPTRSTVIHRWKDWVNNLLDFPLSVWIFLDTAGKTFFFMFYSDKQSYHHNHFFLNYEWKSTCNSTGGTADLEVRCRVGNNRECVKFSIHS